MPGPIFDNHTNAANGNTVSFTVGSNVRQAMVLWSPDQGDQTGPVAPSAVTYAGAYPTWTNGDSDGWLGYIVNPTQGSNSLVNGNLSGTDLQAAVFYDVDQSAPFAIRSKNTTANTPSPFATPITTTYGNSLLLKDFRNTNFNKNWANGSGETSIWNEISGNRIASYLPTTAAGQYQMQTTWTNAGNAYASQEIVELKWGGAMSEPVAVTTANSASRLAAAATLGAFGERIAVITANSANRLASAGTAFYETLSVATANAAGRLAAAGSLLKAAFHAIAKTGSGAWSALTKRQ